MLTHTKLKKNMCVMCSGHLLGKHPAAQSMDPHWIQPLSYSPKHLFVLSVFL